MDPDCLLPPPAYSEQEFDQKISQATALSLRTSQACLTNIDPDSWPQYDPAVFETTSASEDSSTSSTTVERSSPFPVETSLGKKDDYMQYGIINDLPSVVPLRIEKKSQQKSNLAQLPAISQLGNEGSLTIGENPTPTLFDPGTYNRDDFRSQPHSVQSTCAEDDVSFTSLTTVPPVRFTQIGPNHERDANLPSMPPPPPFEAQLPACPPEPSLLARSFVYGDHYQHVDPYNVTSSQPPRHSLAIQSRPQFVPQERPMTSYPPSPNKFQSSYVPRLDFNPSIAYRQTQPVAPSAPLKQPVKNVQYDPHDLYNSAVSAQITPITTGQRGHSSYNSRNSFSPQKQYQQHESPVTHPPPGHYGQSFVLQNPLSLERCSPPSEMNSSRRSVLQPPMRPSESYSMSSNSQTFNTSPSPVYQYVSHKANVPGNIYYDQKSSENRWSTQ